MSRALALILALVLASCGSSNNVTAEVPASCKDACAKVYGTGTDPSAPQCSSAVNLGSGALDLNGCQNACANANQLQAESWTCVNDFTPHAVVDPVTKQTTVDCSGLDNCLLPLACPGAASVVLTCTGQSQSATVLTSCKAQGAAFRPCLDCIGATPCPTIGSACAAACGFP